jgi:hypothetical protein
MIILILLKLGIILISQGKSKECHFKRRKKSLINSALFLEKRTDAK